MGNRSAAIVGVLICGVACGTSGGFSGGHPEAGGGAVSGAASVASGAAGAGMSSGGAAGSGAMSGAAVSGAMVGTAGSGAMSGAADAAGDASDAYAPAVSGADGANDAAGVDAAAEAQTSPASGTPLRALAVTTGLLHTCALLDNHGVKCWGQNDWGELGAGDTRARGALASDMGDALPFVDLGTGRTAMAVSAGRYHTCAILDDGSVKCWGRANYTGVPFAPGDFALGDQPGEMGDNLPALDLGVGRTATLLAAGYADSCAVLDDDSLRCWGDPPGAPLPAPALLASTAKIVQLAPGSYGAIARLEDGSVFETLRSGVMPAGRASWALSPATFIAGSYANSCLVTAAGAASCALVPSLYWPLAMPTGLLELGISAEEFACGLFVDGSVRCWRGPCSSGAPGALAMYWCSGPPQADGSVSNALGQPAVALTTAGLLHMCALLADGSVKCWTNADFCSSDSGGVLSLVGCVPEKGNQDPNLGGSVDIVTTANGRKYGAWTSIDLGKHP